MTKEELKIFESPGNKNKKMELVNKHFTLNEIERMLINKYDLVTVPQLTVDGNYIIGVRHELSELTGDIFTVEDAVNHLKKDLGIAVAACVFSFKKFQKLSTIQQAGLIGTAFRLGKDFVATKKMIEECK